MIVCSGVIIYTYIILFWWYGDCVDALVRSDVKLGRSGGGCGGRPKPSQRIPTLRSEPQKWDLDFALSKAALQGVLFQRQWRISF